MVVTMWTTLSVPARTLPAMPQYEWSPPTHPDPPEDQPFGVEGVALSERVDHAPVWCRVKFSRTGWQRVPGFVDADAGERVYVQLVHMGFFIGCGWNVTGSRCGS